MSARVRNLRSMFAIVGILLSVLLSNCLSSSGGSSSTAGTSTAMPLGAVLSGITLSGSLAGKQTYLLQSPANASNCWMDSQYWSGTELFFGISSLDWTALSNGTLFFNPACSPTPGFSPQSVPGTTGNFNIYRGLVSNGKWVLTNLPLNAGQTAGIGAAKLAGSNIAFVKFEKGASNFGNIYLAIRTGDNSYSTPTAFSQNSSSCNDDNPYLFANGNQLIFTSSRTVGSGTLCSGVGTKSFWSSTLSSGTWSIPVGLSGAPGSASNSVDQAWIDSSGTLLYWTGTGSDCTGSGILGCIKSASGSGITWSASANQIVTPDPIASWPLTVPSGSFVTQVGQFSQANGYSVMACGVTYLVGTSATSGLTSLNGTYVFQSPVSGPPYYYYHTDFRSCVVPD